MRFVLTGTPQHMLTVTPADLPADKNLQFSYFYRCNLSPLSLVGFNLMDTDFIDCHCDGVDMTGAQTDGLYSRRSSWNGAKLPPDIPFLAHDLVVEAAGQRLNAVAPGDRPLVQLVRDRVADGTYLKSWDDSVDALLSNPAAQAVWRTVCAPYPNLAHRFEEAIKEVAAGIVPVYTASNTVKVGDVDVPMPTTTFPEDRVEAGLLLEPIVSAIAGRPMLVRVHQVTPFPAIEWTDAPNPKPDWWR